MLKSGTASMRRLPARPNRPAQSSPPRKDSTARRQRWSIVPGMAGLQGSRVQRRRRAARTGGGPAGGPAPRRGRRGRTIRRLEDEVAGGDGDVPRELDLALGAVRPAGVQLDDRVVALEERPGLALGREAGPADEGEGLVARGPGLGVDGVQVELVDAVLEVGDHVAVAEAHAAVGGVEVPERVGLLAARDVAGQRVGAGPAGEDVAADVALD